MVETLKELVNQSNDPELAFQILLDCIAAVMEVNTNA